VKELAVEWTPEIKVPIFYGRRTGPLSPTGEITPDVAIKAITDILKVEYTARDAGYERKANDTVQKMVPPRALTICPGCPHRATYWAIKTALKLDGREGFATGDIGCYGFGVGPPGYSILRTMQCMGSSTGVGYGLGKLGQFGMEQPVISVCGDGTFYHAAMPALLSAVSNRSNLTMMILDNEAIAMTGFQPHPGTDHNAMGDEKQRIPPEDVCRSLGVKVVMVADPYDIKDTTEKILELIRSEEEGVKVLIMRRKCALLTEGKAYSMSVDPEKCYGEACGCANLCTRLFKCPGLIWDRETKKAKIDDALCIGCGVCAEICPQGAIMRESSNEKEVAKI